VERGERRGHDAPARTHARVRGALPDFESDDAAIGRIDVVSVSLPLQAMYQITPWFGLAAGDAFLRQRADTNVVRMQRVARGLCSELLNQADFPRGRPHVRRCPPAS
jgi:hypothetical protein